MTQNILYPNNININYIMSVLMKLLSMDNVIALFLTVMILSGHMPNKKLSYFLTSAKGYFVLALLFLISLYCCNPMVSIVLVIAIYDMVRKAHIQIQKSFDTYLPSEATRNEYMKEVDYFPDTLEEDVISSMVKPVEYAQSGNDDVNAIEDSKLDYSSI